MLLQHIWDFAIAVISNWVAMAGGIVGVAIGLYEQYRKRPFIGQPFWRAMSATLLVACFWAWQDERQQVEKLHLDKTSLTPKELVQVFDDRTSAQGEELAAGYTGKWIEVSGMITDVEFFPNGLFWKRARVPIVNRDIKDFPFILGSFVEKWTETFKGLRPGERVRALGQISRISRGMIVLENCELLEVVRPVAPSPTPTP